MQFSLITSVLLHVAILAYAIVGFASPREFKPKPPTPVAVDVLTEADFSELTAGKKDPKPEEKKAPQKKAEPKKESKNKSKKKAVLPPKKVEPKKKEPEPKKKAKPVPDEKAIALKKKKAEEKKKAEKKKKEEARKREEEKKRRAAKSKNKKFDSDKIAALLNKIPDAGAEKSEPKSKTKPEKKKPAKGQGGLSKRAAASIGAQIKRRIQNNCWNLPIGGRDVDNLVLKITFNLDKGGRIKGLPNVKTPVRGPAAIAVAESAKRAILACQPYYEFTTRAPDNYDDWREVTMNFDMRDMYGSY